MRGEGSFKTDGKSDRDEPSQTSCPSIAPASGDILKTLMPLTDCPFACQDVKTKTIVNILSLLEVADMFNA